MAPGNTTTWRDSVGRPGVGGGRDVVVIRSADGGPLGHEKYTSGRRAWIMREILEGEKVRTIAWAHQVPPCIQTSCGQAGKQRAGPVPKYLGRYLTRYIWAYLIRSWARSSSLHDFVAHAPSGIQSRGIMVGLPIRLRESTEEHISFPAGKSCLGKRWGLSAPRGRAKRR